MSDGSKTEEGTVGPSAAVLRARANLLPPWKKGQTGNPKGVVSTAYMAARKICAQHTEKAALKQIELIDDPDSRVAFMAIEAVLNRGAGKPRDHSNEEHALQSLDISVLTVEEQDMLLGFIKRIMAARRPGGERNE